MNEWPVREMNTKSNDYGVVWHMLLKRERGTKFNGIPEKGTTNSRTFRGNSYSWVPKDN